MKWMQSDYHWKYYNCSFGGEVYEVKNEFVNVGRISAVRIERGEYLKKQVYCVVGHIPWDFDYCFSIHETQELAEKALNRFLLESI